MNTSDTQNLDTPRPFGYWLTAVDRLMAADFDAAFESEHASRRDWRLLNVIDGSAPARRPLNPRKLADVIERGWVAADGDGWTLTDEGRDAKDRLATAVEGIRAKVSDAVSPEDLATTLASLEGIARAFGWDEDTPLPRGRGGRGRGRGGRGHGHHGFGPHGRHGFGPHGHHGFGAHGRQGFDPRGRHGFGHGDADHGDADHGDVGPEHRGPGHAFGPDRFGPDHAAADHGFGPRLHRGHDAGRCPAHPRHAHGEHRRHEGHRAARAAQQAYERGFDAGFSRGRDA